MIQAILKQKQNKINFKHTRTHTHTHTHTYKTLTLEEFGEHCPIDLAVLAVAGFRAACGWLPGFLVSCHPLL